MKTTIPPRPEPPPPPEDGQCCDSGCDYCVWDMHREDMAHYAMQLVEWEALREVVEQG